MERSWSQLEFKPLRWSELRFWKKGLRNGSPQARAPEVPKPPDLDNAVTKYVNISANLNLPNNNNIVVKKKSFSSFASKTQILHMTQQDHEQEDNIEPSRLSVQWSDNNHILSKQICKYVPLFQIHHRVQGLGQGLFSLWNESFVSLKLCGSIST